MTEWICDFLMARGLDETISTYISGAIMMLFIFLAAALAHFIAKKPLLKILRTIISKSKTKWDDTLFRHKVFERLLLVIPALVVYVAAPLSPYGQEWLRRIAFCLIVFGFLRAFDKFLNAIDDIYRKSEASKIRPIKGYLQVLKIAAYVIGIVVIISALMDRSPLLLLGGIGAATAVLLLVFQNTILGFVASIQLTENDMVRLGDWIEMPNHNANGDVIEISLHTVKVQNGDKTITTIPTYSMVSESFKNWRFMQEAGGRRINRAVNIDITSIKFCNEEMLERYKKICYIQEYLKNKTSDIHRCDQTDNADSSSIANGRHLTNIGIFRAYVDAYLKNHPGIHQGMTRLVRQLNPTEHGLPIEIYAFTSTTGWNEYEAIQADIFEHIFAIIPEFDLRIFQSPTGHDLAKVHTGRL
jgi:miniconductance mechanosensitive channel